MGKYAPLSENALINYLVITEDGAAQPPDPSNFQRLQRTESEPSYTHIVAPKKYLD